MFCFVSWGNCSRELFHKQDFLFFESFCLCGPRGSFEFALSVPKQTQIKIFRFSPTFFASGSFVHLNSVSRTSCERQTRKLCLALNIYIFLSYLKCLVLKVSKFIDFIKNILSLFFYLFIFSNTVESENVTYRQLQNE